MTRLFFFFLCSLLICGTAFAGTGAAKKPGNSLFDRWEAQHTTSIQLYVNFDSLEVYRKKATSLPAVVIENGKSLDLDVTVRGKFRRRTCAMPPLKLKFKKEGLRAAGLTTHNDFKLVTHCTNDAAGQDALLREQLVYELYNTIAPSASFRTKLLTIDYVNTADGSTTTSYAILIEDTDELKNRLDSENCKDCFALPADRIQNAESFALFQYMIGNSDFSNRMTRNMKMMAREDGTYVAVPYDFDFSGLVNAPYASGCDHLNETKVTDRSLIWEYASVPDFGEVAAEYLGLKAQLLDQVMTFEGLETASKREITRYLKSFFRELARETIIPFTK